MRTDGPSIRYRTVPLVDLGQQVVRLVSERLIQDGPQSWEVVESTTVDSLDPDAALELMLQLGGTVTAVMRARREAQDRGEYVPPGLWAARSTPAQAAPDAPAGVNPGMHVFGPEDGPTVTLTLPRSVVLTMHEALRHVPASTGVDGALLDEISYQLSDQPE
jgi:hypothetical protein